VNHWRVCWQSRFISSLHGCSDAVFTEEEARALADKQNADTDAGVMAEHWAEEVIPENETA